MTCFVLQIDVMGGKEVLVIVLQEWEVLASGVIPIQKQLKE